MELTETSWNVLIVFGPLFLIALGVLIWALTWDKRSQKRAEKNGGVDPVKEAEEARTAARMREQRERRAEYEAKMQMKKDDRTVVRTKLLTDQSTYTSRGSVTSAAGRAVVGNLVAGPIGAMVGAGTAKRTTQEQKSQVFKVWYKSGREGIETAAVGSARWKELVEKLEE